MPELSVSPLMYDKTPLFTDDADITKAKKALYDMSHSIEAFLSLINNSTPQKSDGFTHLSLLEHYISDLSAATHYDGMVAKEVENRHKDLRNANIRIRELEAQIGAQVSGNAVAAGMRHWEDVFRAWYEATGFHYASMSYSPFALIADFSDELTNKQRDRNLASREMLAKISGKVKFITTDPSWDVEPDQFHSNLKDTDKNKANLMQMYAVTFPGARISKFVAHADGGKYYLRHTVTIPWKDVDDWYAKTTGESSEDASK